MSLRHRSYLYFEDQRFGLSESVDVNWITGVKKWWKKWVDQSKKISKLRGKKGSDAVLKYIDTGVEYIDSIKNDLLYKKGYWPYGMTANSKDDDNRVPMMQGIRYMDQALELLSSMKEAIEYASSMVIKTSVRDFDYNRSVDLREKKWGPNKDLDGLDSMINNLVVDIKPVNQVIVGGFLNVLHKAVLLAGTSSIYDVDDDNLDLEYSIGSMKIFIRPNMGSSVNARSMVANDDSILKPTDLKRYVSGIKSVYQLIKKAGFEKVWYGILNIRPGISGRDFKLSSGVTYKMQGSWSHSDSITLSLDMYNRFPDTISGVLAHELGHRWYYKFMSSGDRLRFDSYFGVVTAITGYGKENSSEDFATIFEHYIMGNKLSRDQKERFVEFAIKGKGLIRHESAMVFSELLLRG